MIRYTPIAGGGPSAASRMAGYLMRPTLPEAEARQERQLTGEERVVETFARLVADGSLGFGEAADALVGAYIANGGDLDRIDEETDRISADLAVRADAALAEPVTGTAPVIRPDLDPIVAVGLGIGAEPLSQAQVSALLSGRRADGAPIEGKHYPPEREGYTHIGSYDFALTPHKEISVAWAFAGPAERAVIHTAHITAARDAMAALASEIGTARTGHAGTGPREPGYVAWLEFTHFTAHPTPGAPGDPNIHTHAVIPNAVFCESGRVGSLDTRRIDEASRRATDLYHERLFAELRAAGFAPEMTQHRARLPSVEPEATQHYSKRSNEGMEIAEEAALLDGRKAGKRDVHHAVKHARLTMPSKARADHLRDDVADTAAWRAQAARIGYTPPASFARAEVILPAPKPSLARTMVARAAELRQATTRLLQRVLHVHEQREARGERPTLWHERHAETLEERQAWKLAAKLGKPAGPAPSFATVAQQAGQRIWRSAHQAARDQMASPAPPPQRTPKITL